MTSLRFSLSAFHGTPRQKSYIKLPPQKQKDFLFFLATLLACLGFNGKLNKYKRNIFAALSIVKKYNRAVFAYNRMPEFALYRAIIARDTLLRKELNALHDDYQAPVFMAKRVDRQRQLHTYLARIGLFHAEHFIDAVKIALLEQNDMVSAASIDMSIANIQGIGKQTTRALLDWREELEMKFMYLADDSFIDHLKRDIRASYPEKSLMILLELDALQQQWANTRATLNQASIMFDKQHPKN
ncbi:MAG: hypothetical protein EOO42_00895 [Flavobacteriales bacterium]|nr:MAG: hypothetical protein EOO42_00895 [Flavobacteriales bacterium]